MLSWYWFSMVIHHTKMTNIYKTILAESFHIKLHIERKTMKNRSTKIITKWGGNAIKEYIKTILLEGLITFAQWSELHLFQMFPSTKKIIWFKDANECKKLSFSFWLKYTNSLSVKYQSISLFWIVETVDLSFSSSLAYSKPQRELRN